MDRRSFLRGVGVFAGAAIAGRGDGLPKALQGPDAKRSNQLEEAVRDHASGLPTASWVVEENARLGNRGWVISPRHSRPGIEGYVDKTSVARGEELTLFVNTTAPSWRAAIFRMGYYQGRGGRLVHQTPDVPARAQPAAKFTPGINMVECHWHASRAFGIDATWLPGAYLIKLIGSRGELQHVPFTVRDDASTAAFVVQSSVTTWQAYNPWGGYSLYGGVPNAKRQTYETRSRVVSFDRPYGSSSLALDVNGSGDFLGNEFPFIYLAERLGLDLTYRTDLDLHTHPDSLLNHRCFISLGHDEYWSAQMRDGAELGLTHGVNLAFLGANACYRQVRFEPSELGVNRRMICYKDAKEDPITRTRPVFATGGSWATDPVPRPESRLIGVMYQSFGANAPLVIADGSSFVFAGTGLKTHDKVHGTSTENVVGSEFDGFEPRLSPSNDVTILAHSPVKSVSGNLASDMTYYTKAGGGGVFATGTARWVPCLWSGNHHIDNALSFGVSPAMKPLTQITLNVLRVLGRGPASKTHPSVGNWRKFYSESSPVHLGIDVTGH